MVQAIIDISKETNRVLNIIKARKGLRTKSQAIDEMAREFEVLEPELKPEYILRLKKLERQKGIKVEDFSKRYLR